MPQVTTYLNFPRNTEEVFNFYKGVFGTEFEGDIMRLGDVPLQEGQPPILEDDKNLVMHIALPTIGNHLLRGTDAPESMGFTLTQGNNVNISLEPDSKEHADTLFAALSDGVTPTMPIQDMFWGSYFGMLTDKFGINWMVNFDPKREVQA